MKFALFSVMAGLQGAMLAVAGIGVPDPMFFALSAPVWVMGAALLLTEGGLGL